MSSLRVNAICLTFLSLQAMFGATIFNSGVNELTPADPSQTGRLFRTGVPSDWSTQKPYPGVTAATSQFYYDEFVIPSVTFPYIQITFNDINNTGATFVAAYVTSYQPSNLAPKYGLDINYLGDIGSSGDFALNDPRAFQVIVPTGDNLVIVVSETGILLQQPFEFLAEGFYNTEYSDAPELRSFAMTSMGAGCGMLLFCLYRRRRAAT